MTTRLLLTLFLVTNIAACSTTRSNTKPLFARSAEELFDGSCLTLAKATAAGNVSVVTELAGFKGQANCRGYFGTTPLYWAIASKQTSPLGLEALLKAGGDPNAYLDSGEALVHIAAMRGDPEIMRLLLELVGNPNLRSKNGETPLFFLQPDNGYRLVPSLLSAGADADVVTPYGKTAMMALAATRQFRAIDLLLKSGADWRPKSKSGDSLLAIISRVGSTWDVSSPEYPYFLKVKAFLRPRSNNSFKPKPLRGSA